MQLTPERTGDGVRAAVTAPREQPDGEVGRGEARRTRAAAHELVIVAAENLCRGHIQTRGRLQASLVLVSARAPAPWRETRGWRVGASRLRAAARAGRGAAAALRTCAACDRQERSGLRRRSSRRLRLRRRSSRCATSSSSGGGGHSGRRSSNRRQAAAAAAAAENGCRGRLP